jgi:hypothetical protein
MWVLDYTLLLKVQLKLIIDDIAFDKSKILYANCMQIEKQKSPTFL